MSHVHAWSRSVCLISKYFNKSMVNRVDWGHFWYAGDKMWWSRVSSLERESESVRLNMKRPRRQGSVRLVAMQVMVEGVLVAAVVVEGKSVKMEEHGGTLVGGETGDRQVWNRKKDKQWKGEEEAESWAESERPDSSHPSPTLHVPTFSIKPPNLAAPLGRRKPESSEPAISPNP